MELRPETGARPRYALPLHAVAAGALPRPRAAVAGGGAAFVALAVQTAADAQKFLAKRREPDAPVVGGLWSWSRHPNYFAEIVLNLGLAAAAAANSPSIAAAWVASLAPLAMCFIVLGATNSLDARQQLRYRGDAHDAYRATTPRLVPLVGGVG